ncbi:MAG TPA: NAD-dependent epimerase/dehydratase family protein [Candidatus Saccharimonadales bacterium]|nr:NAD-dependent epimerase/dehydratase family protein [Candidatus Saccharimonadales bacterium]
MSKTTLVTGAAGFIGSHTAQALLDRGDTVVALDNLNAYYSRQLKLDRVARLKKSPNFHFYEKDLTDKKAVDSIFKNHPLDNVCHLAAQAGVRYSLENPYAYIDSNVLGTTVIFETAKQNDVKHIVYASSSSVYGKNKGKVFHEKMRLHTPISLYAATKKATELIAHSYHHLFGIESTGLRFFTVYGPWGRPDMFAFLLAKAITENETVKVFNEGKMHRDFTYIDDIVSGVVAALDQPLGYETLNLGGANTTLLNDFIALIEKSMGKTAKKTYLPLQPGDVLRTSANVDRARKLLGWEPKVRVEQGVKNFTDWFRDYYPTLKKAKDY